MLSSYDANAKWELKIYWEDGATIECRYFGTMKEAEAYAESEGIAKEDYSVVPHSV